MNIDLRPSTRRMVEQSTATTEAWGFIEWLRAERYTDYTIDCHIRRLLFVMPRLAPGASPPILRDSALVAVFGRERRPHSRFTNFAGTRRAYTRYLSAEGRFVREPEAASPMLLICCTRSNIQSCFICIFVRRHQRGHY
jgi:hypothetical protein